MVEAQNTGFVTSGWCQKHLKVVRDTANRDFAGLDQLGLLAAADVPPLKVEHYRLRPDSVEHPVILRTEASYHGTEYR